MTDNQKESQRVVVRKRVKFLGFKEEGDHELRNERSFWELEKVRHMFSPRIQKEGLLTPCI